MTVKDFLQRHGYDSVALLHRLRSETPEPKREYSPFAARDDRSARMLLELLIVEAARE